MTTAAPSTNGKPRSPRSKATDHSPAPLPRVRKAKSAPLPPHADLRPWAYTGVAGTLALSGWLNGLAFSVSAPTPLHGWVLGLAIPCLILVFSRVAALCYARQRKAIAAAGAMACLSMLLLSVQHCALSISRLTGENVALAALMALAIDAGLVVCELATLSTAKR